MKSQKQSLANLVPYLYSHFLSLRPGNLVHGAVSSIEVLSVISQANVKGASLLLTALFIAFSAGAELDEHVWWSRLGMGLATAALAAWVTLAVVQVALRGENYKTYGLPAFYAIQSQIRILCFHISSRLLRSNNRTNILVDAFWHGPTTEVPQHIDELGGMLLERLNDVRPKPGVSLNPKKVIEIRNFYRLLDNWWHTMEPMLATAGANARLRETVPAIHTYRHNIAFWLSDIRDISEENDPEGEQLLLDCIRNITISNRGIYSIILAETESH